MLSDAREQLLSLLTEVKADPNDITSWMVLCDWLEDQPNELNRLRGEYCRLCFGRQGKKVYASDWETGERRRWISIHYRHHWLGPLFNLNGVKLRDGLIQIDTSGEAVLSLLDKGLTQEQWAWVETLNLYYMDQGTIDQLLQQHLLRGVPRIHLHYNNSRTVPTAVIRTLAESPDLDNVHSFYLEGQNSAKAFAPLRERFGKKFRTFS